MQNQSIIQTVGSEATENFEETLKKADLNWEVCSEPVRSTVSGITAPRKKMLFRSDNQEFLGIVGEDYVPTSPREFLNAQFQLAERMGGTITRVGFLPSQAKGFAFIKSQAIELPKQSRRVGDIINGYVYVTDGWNGGHPRKSQMFFERLVCLNGMTTKQLDQGFWCAHTKKSAPRFKERFEKFMGSVHTSLETTRKTFLRLRDKQLSQANVENFLLELVPGDNTTSSNRRGKILELFSRTGTGIHGSSAYDVYNAVTEFSTHHRRGRESGVTPSEVNRFLGVVESNTLPEKALALLMRN